MRLVQCENRNPASGNTCNTTPQWTKLWNDPFIGFSGFFPSNSLSQTATWHEDDSKYEVRLEAPGLKKEELKLSLENDLLVLRGKKRVKSQGEEQTVEIERAITIPEGVDSEKIEARYEDGLLDVILPKREEIKPKEISIQIK